MNLSKGRPDQTTEYARSVVDGQIVAGKFVRAACKRHLDDMATASKRGLVWNVEKAERALRFFPVMLSVTEGAAEGKPFHPLPWHVFVIGSIFGWYRKDGLRRFRWAWLETGKGQAKSPLMAAIGLYIMGWENPKKRRTQVYAIASDKNQANVLFKDAVAMCRAPLPDSGGEQSLVGLGLIKISGNNDNSWRLEYVNRDCIFKSLATDRPSSGHRPSCVLADEVHEFRLADPIQSWKAAIDKMSGDPIMILGTNTPSSAQIVGTEYSEMFQRVVVGDAEDDTAFAYIARVDEDDDPFEDESCWQKALPALGITYPIENVRNRVKTSKLLLSEALATKRLYFGIPVGTSGFWINEAAWAASQGEFALDDMAGCRCTASLDLSQKNDLTALTLAFEKDEKVFAHSVYWTTQDGLADRERDDKAPYSRWVDAGALNATVGAVIDKEFVAAEISSLHSRFNFEALVFDPAGIGDFMAACERIGFAVWMFDGDDKPKGVGLKLVRHGQGAKPAFLNRSLCMPRSIERLEDAIKSQRLVVQRNPVTTMCAANAKITADAMNNRMFDKIRSRGRIDGVVTLAMAVGALLANESRGGDIDGYFASLGDY